MKLNSVDRELNRLHVGIKVSFIKASLCACAANFWNLIRKAFNNCTCNKSVAYNGRGQLFFFFFSKTVLTSIAIYVSSVKRQKKKDTKTSYFFISEVSFSQYIALT